MSKHLVWAASLGAAIFLAGTASAQTLAFSFEDIIPGGPDGFFGLGATTAQESVLGVTHLANSISYSAGAAGFVGIRTETVPLTLNNPPGVDHVLFDMYVPAIPVGISFADIGITVFGHDLDNGIFGIQNQFTDTVSITSLGVGQHYDLRIDLDSEFFTGESFNQIFGDDVSDLDVAAGFQLYMSKTAGTPMTIYIDNVRFVVPEPTTFGMLGLGAAVFGFSRRRRR